MRHPLTKEAFADWASKQPADGEYDYGNSFNCATCQYFRHIGLPFQTVNQNTWRDLFAWHDLPAGFNKATVTKPHTYGALSERLRR